MPQPRPRPRTAGSARDRHPLAVIAGLAIGALGIVIQFVAAPERFAVVFGVPFPPGLVYVLGAIAIVWFDRRSAWSPMAAIALSAWIVLGGLLAGDLTANLTSADQILVSGNVVMVLGLLASVVAGVVAVARSRRGRTERFPAPLGARNPRRRWVAVTLVGLVLAGVTLAVAERMEFRGAGPIPFLILPVAVALVRGKYAVGLALVLSVVYLGAVFSNPEPVARLADPSDAVGLASTALHAAFLVLTIVAGITANTPPRQRVADATGTPAIP